MTDLDIQKSSWDVDIGLLIKLVKNFPYLYNQNYEEFKNIHLRERTWNKISTAIKISSSDCQRMWKNLRDKYSRERRTHLEHPGIPSQWEFYDSMTFLQPFVKRRRRTKRKVDRKWFMDVKKEENENTEQKICDESMGVHISLENISFLESELDENGEAEELTVDLVDNLPVKEVSQQQDFVSIVKHHSSEEAFGAYVASRLMDFSLDDRQAKKVKIFKVLEDLDELS